ncbi:MAG: PAS domain S-box protein [Rugosibacter sp.]|nr:PAS domain S-box protein [Rugosibacter sp.]
MLNDHKRSEQTPHASDEYFRDWFEHAHDLIQIMQPDGLILYANRAWRKVLGYSESEIAGLSLQDIIHPSSLSHCMEIFQRIMAADEANDLMEAVLLTRDGRSIVVEGNSHCHSVHGKPAVMCSIFRDITLRKQAEKERGYLFNYALDLHCIAGFDGYFKQLNPAWEKILGWSEAELLSKPYSEFIHPDDRDATMHQIRSIMEGSNLLSGSHVVENRYLCKDGTCKWLSWASFVHVEEGLIFAAARDISESKRIHAALREVMQWQRAILDNAAYAIITSTPEGLITSFNPAAERMLGYTAEEMIGLQTPALIHDETEIAARAQELSIELGETIEPGFDVFLVKARRNLPNEYEWTCIRKNGIRLPTLISITALRDEANSIIGFLGMFVDISERKRIEQLLRAKNEDLKTFAYTVSHDLKAPLRGISGYAQELERRHKEGLSERAQFCITQIITASRNLDNLIEDLLKYSRLDAEVPTLTDIKLPDLVKSILRDCNHTLTELSVEVRVNIPPITVHTWERGLHQILSNLIDNAIKYARHAKPPRLTISAEALPEGYLITVTDNGVGFDMKYHDRIFGLFNRLVRADEFEGTGTGLSIVKKLIEKLGGSIRATSAPGQGATFFAELPMTTITETMS